MENGELWHIVAVGLPQDFAPSNSPDFAVIEDQETGPALAQRARDAGAFVAVVHPQWSGLTLADARSMSAAHAIEIYNHSSAVGCDRPDGAYVADLLLSEGHDITLIATDDAHFTEPDHFGGWVMVKATENSPEALLAALKAGHFYASQGPEIRHAEVRGDRLVVECTAAATVIAQGAGSAAVAVHGNSMTRAEIKLDHFVTSGWLRVTVVDRAGKRAITNPVRLAR